MADDSDTPLLMSPSPHAVSSSHNLVTLLQAIKQQYDTTVRLNYLEIEKELIAKGEYDNDSVQEVMLQVFQCVLLKAFGIKNVDNPEQLADATKTQIVPLVAVIQTALLNHCPPFAAFFRTYCEQHATQLGDACDACDECDDLIFMTLFSYDLFPQMHRCICQFVESDGTQVEADTLEGLRECVQRLKKIFS